MTPNRNRTFLLSAAACGLFFSASLASAQEQQTSQQAQRRRAPVAATRAPQEGGLIGALPGQTGQQQQAGAAAATPVAPEATTLPALEPDALNPEAPAQAQIVDPDAAVEIDMPLGDEPVAIERPAQSQASRGQRGQVGQRGQLGQAQGERPIDFATLEEPSAPLAPEFDTGAEILPPGDLDALEPSAQGVSQEDQAGAAAQTIAAPEAKKPGFFRRMWTKIKDGTKKGVGIVKSWFTRDKAPETAAPAPAPSDAPLTDISLGGGD